MRRCRRFLQPTDRRVMIAKILKHSKSFAGIEYNRLKTENGKAEMLEAKNFELEAMVGLTGQPSAATYLDFLNYVSDRRPDVNYRQFHAVISCAGRELSKEQLLNRINQVSFAVDDMILYLDTHPDDEEARAYFEEKSALRNEALEEYAAPTGRSPLTPPTTPAPVPGNGLISHGHGS